MDFRDLLIAATLSTALEFGVKSDQIDEFRAALTAKINDKRGPVYTAAFVRALKDQYAGSTHAKPTPKSRSSKQPAPPIERSESAWVPVSMRNADDPTRIANAAIVSSINSDLNKLTEAKYDVISARVITKITENVLPEFVDMMFDKAVWDAGYRGMYARLCVSIQAKLDGFRQLLLTECQRQFGKDPPTPVEGETKQDREYEMVKWKKMRSGNMHFVVELLKVNMVQSKVISMCLYELLSHDVLSPISDNIFHAAELLMISKTLVDRAITGPAVNRIREFLSAGKLGNREKFKCQDVVGAYK